MPNDDDIRTQLEILMRYRQTLRFLLDQAIIYGSELLAPPQTRAGLEEMRAGVMKCKRVLSEWGVIVEDLPEDVASASVRRQATTTGIFQLRAPVADFLGRDNALAYLVAALRSDQTSRRASISGIRGMGGSGKTELAYAAAMRIRADYPDGQILLDLRGTSISPLRPEQALQEVISLFRPEDKLPEELSVLQKLYYAALADKKLLILADDARDAAQVRYLLPPVGSALLVTSRQRFTLDGMITLDLERLDEISAVSLLRGICSRLTKDEAQKIAVLCGYLPLALRISGSILQNDFALHPERYLTDLANHRLASLCDPDDIERDITATLSLSYATLNNTEQAAFRCLGVVAADANLDLLARILDQSEIQTESTLRLLLRRSLIEFDPVNNRWNIHDLVRFFALERLVEAGEERLVRLRYAEYVIWFMEQAEVQYLKGREWGLIGLALFDREQAHRDDVRTWIWSMSPDLAIDDLIYREATATTNIEDIREPTLAIRILRWKHAIAAAQRQGDRKREGQALGNLGVAYRESGDLRNALFYYKQHLAIACENGDRLEESKALCNLGTFYASSGDMRTAINYYEQDIAITRDLGDRRGEGITLHNMGIAYRNLGEAEIAISCLNEQLVIAREIGNQHGESQALGSIGELYCSLGELSKAIEYHEQQLSIARDVGDRQSEGIALGNLGNVAFLLGQFIRAQLMYQESLTIFHKLEDRWFESILRSNLAETARRQGMLMESIAEVERALKLSRELQDQGAEILAMEILSRTLYDQGYFDRANMMLVQALDLAYVLENRERESGLLDVLAAVYAAQNRPVDADSTWLRALTIAQEIGAQGSVAEIQWIYGQFLVLQGDRERGIELMDACVIYEQKIGHAQNEDHKALVNQLRQET